MARASGEESWSEVQGSHAGLPQPSSLTLDVLPALFLKGKR